jgi:assimilatory nitrate reductase catalytic subunit
VTVDVAPTDGVPPGVVWLPIHNAAANELTLSEVDPESAEPNFKQCAVGLQVPERSQSESDELVLPR